MKVIELYKKGLILSGQRKDEEYLITGEAPDELFFINQALLDLCLKEADSVLEERNLNTYQRDAAAYSIAYHLTLHCGDGEKSEYLSRIYSGKRATALSSTAVRSDILPRTLR